MLARISSTKQSVVDMVGTKAVRGSICSALILVLYGCAAENRGGGDGGTGDAAIEPCAPGTWTKGGDGATACAAWSDCQPGEYVASAGTSTTDRQCAPCGEGSFSSTTNAGTCQAWGSCVAGQYASDSASATKDRICSGCASGLYSTTANAQSCIGWTTCTVGNYVSTEGSVISDRSCAACRDGTYSSQDNQSACVPHGACAAGTKLTAAGSAIARPTCEPCAAGFHCAGANAPAVACVDGKWDHDQDPATECVAKTNCVSGQYVIAEGSATVDRRCATCAQGHYSMTENASACTGWTNCTAGQHVATPGSTTADQTCSACSSGSYSSTTNANSCAGWTTCAAGRYVTSPGSATVNRTCSACESGTYSNGDNQSSCLPHGQCLAGTVQTEAGSDTKPPTCEACSAGSYCAGGETPAATCVDGTWDDDQNPATECIAKTNCISGQYVTNQGSTKADRQCAACDSGKHSTAQNASVCIAWTECTPGKYVASSGSATVDRTCALCQDGTHSSGNNQSSCLPHGECAPGAVQTAAGTATQATTCEPCAVGNYCAGGDTPAAPCLNGTSDHDNDPATQCIGNQNYQQAVLADSPYIYWRMNEVAGTDMVDSSGNGRHGTYSGGFTLGAAGIAEAGVTFNGSSGSAAYAPLETVNGTFTVELWIKPTIDSHAVLFTTWGVSGGTQFDMQRYQGRPHGDIGTGSGWLTTGADTSNPIPMNQWTHLVYVVTPTGWTIYENGVETANGSYSGTPLLFDTSTPLTVASHGPSLHFGGTMDEVAVYTTALSATRIAAHYAAR